jgi:hypothetical protein
MTIGLNKTLLLVLVLASATRVAATCGDTQNQRSPETDSWTCQFSVTTITKTVHWTVYWLDGYSRNIDVTDYGELGGAANGLSSCPSCWPGFKNQCSPKQVARHIGIN